jgi:hypothetical protein
MTLNGPRDEAGSTLTLDSTRPVLLEENRLLPVIADHSGA